MTTGTLAERPPRYDLDALLQVAVAVFTERGYDGTSMDDVARSAGLSKSSLYHHIDGKEQLLRLALQRALDPLFAVLSEPAAGTGRAIDRLEYVVRREVAVLAEHLPYVTLLLRVRGNTATERWALQRRREFDRVVTALVTEAARDGDVRPDIDASTLTRLVFGLVNSLADWFRPAGRPAEVERVADAVVAVAFCGLRVPIEEEP